MDEIYNQEYYQKYDIGKPEKTNYIENEQLRSFFHNFAEAVVEKYHPKTVLDAGCALGILVDELRKLGVEAYGIDGSEYAVSNAVEGIRQYCAVCRIQDELPQDFPKQFDLITNIEVMEHLDESECAAAVKNLCSHTKRIIFSSTSTDFEDPTHINVNKIDYWAEKFAENGFYNNIENRPEYISADAYCFEYSDSPAKYIAFYEKALKKIKDESISVSESNKHNSELVLRQEEEIDRLNHVATVLRDERNEIQQDLMNISSHYSEILNSQYWRITAPFRKITGAIEALLRKSNITRYPCKAIKFIFKYGFRNTFRVIKQKLNLIKQYDYSKISHERRLREENTNFERDIKFSILVPLYNTPIVYLKEMIQSVQNQTYKNWELCLADGSDDRHGDVGNTVREYVKNDSRIVYKKLEKNGGISENTNACIEMATGDYIALFDHDDYLHPSVLFENMKAICETGADFLYTDEVVFEGDNISKIISTHFKPDFAIDNLRANNYICHFSVFSRELLDKVGGFRPECDGSQDHDIILRLTSKAKKVWHIRKLLYFWRSHPNSVAGDIGSKPYVVEAGIKAVRDSLERDGFEGCRVESSKVFPTIYRIKYALKEFPLVSIVIANRNHTSDLRKCVESVLGFSTYRNYEIIIVENGSSSAETFEYYDTLKNYKNIKLLEYSKPFNYSEANNFGAENASGDYIVFLNNHTAVISPSWIEEMLMYAQRNDVGAVGAKLYCQDKTIQHAGIILGLGEKGIAGRCHYRLPKENLGYMGKLFYAQNFSAVTSECIMIKKSSFESAGGFDSSFGMAFSGIDLCLKLREKDLLIVWNPYAELYHYESKNKDFEDIKEKKVALDAETEHFRKKWQQVLEKGDPYYNPNFSLDTDYQVQFSKLKHDCCQ